MKKQNMNQVLKKEIDEIKPSSAALKEIKKTAEDFIKHLEKQIKKKKIKADVFIGGSLAKGTLTRKKKYDVDVFIRFDSKYSDKEIGKYLGGFLKNAKKIHGSRDYYQIIVKEIIFEIIPVVKIKKPEHARNITDLSFFHVNYIKKKLKNKKLAEEILLAKTFAHAQKCYGAESYIQGFSGYALELLICHYKSFKTFIGAILKMKSEKLVIDSERKYKNKNDVLRELNEARLQSPIILIDPTYKERNALAGLSSRTLEKFKISCKSFLKNPGSDFFTERNIQNELQEKYKDKLMTVQIKTNKQAGDIAGTKSKKFFGFFVSQLSREFLVKVSEMDYDEKKNIAQVYFVIDKKKDEVIKGPPVIAIHNLTKFKKAHPKAFIKNHFAYAKVKHDLNFNDWFKKFKISEKKIIKDMSVKEVKLI